jgi:hypothetical protein
MGKLKDLAAVKVADSETFVYTPPPQAYGAALILVKPNLGYPVQPPATVSMPILAAVLRGLRRASPKGRIVVVEGVCGKMSVVDIYEKHGLMQHLDAEMRAGDAEKLVMKRYPNLSPAPVKYDEMTAPEYLSYYDCIISVGAFKKTILHDRPLISASLKNLYGLFPRDVYHGRSKTSRGQLHRPSVSEVLKDIYFSIGHLVHGAVVDLTQKYVSPDWKPDRARGVAHDVGKVVWGDDMLAVDETACRIAGEPVADYIDPIRRLRQAMQTD